MRVSLTVLSSTLLLPVVIASAKGDFLESSREPLPPTSQFADDQYHPHFDTTPDYLDIAGRAAGVNGNPGTMSDNFYLVLADAGGCDGGCSTCCETQRQVAQQMREYVANRKAAKPHSALLFVLVGGDNFYWVGAAPGRFNTTWKEVYGEELTDVPWFAVMGNHDYGNDDPSAACPHNESRFVCDSHNSNTPACGGANPYSTRRQGYNSNALDANKGGVDGELRANWVQPDYTYFYTIPALNFELLAMDWNSDQLDHMGGNGFCDGCGAQAILEHCGGSFDELSQSMDKIKEASTRILHERAQAARSKNVAILSHYPPNYHNGTHMRKLFTSWLPQDAQQQTKVFNFYGHDHVQQCDERSNDGECVDFVTGAAGGCCSPDVVQVGFVAIAWDSDTKQKVECFADDSCPYYNITAALVDGL
jgi:hypothetical protein